MSANKSKINLNSPTALLEDLDDDTLEQLITSASKAADKSRSKSVYFSTEEQEFIVDFMLNHTGLPRNANMGPKSNQLNGKLWIKLANDVSNLGVQRTVSQIIYQWSNLKKKATNANSERKKAFGKTGNTYIPPLLSSLHEKVLAIIGTSAGLPLKNGKAGFNNVRNKLPDTSIESQSAHVASTSEENFNPPKSQKQQRSDTFFNLKKKMRDEKSNAFLDESKNNNVILNKIHQELVGLREGIQENNRLQKLNLYIKAKDKGINIDEIDTYVDNTDKEQATSCVILETEKNKSSNMVVDDDVSDDSEYTDVVYIDPEFDNEHEQSDELELPIFSMDSDEYSVEEEKG